MSKPLELDGRQHDLSPVEQLSYFAQFARNRLAPYTLDRVSARARQLDLEFNPEELTIIAALDTPAKVQQFLNTEIYYNHDHGALGVRDETALSPRQVLRSGFAHCFEGAFLAYTVNYIHGHNPRLVLLEARDDYDHNLVVFKDKPTGMFGANAHSRYPHLDGRPAAYSSIRTLAQSYFPHYYMDTDPTTHSLVGYSDPIDIVEKFGTKWMDSMEDLWNIYFTYLGENVKFYDISGDNLKPHLYPFIRAIKEGWLMVDAHNRAGLSINNFTIPGMRELWAKYQAIYLQNNPDLKEELDRVNMQFVALTQTAPGDLLANVRELQSLVDHGFTPEMLLS